MVQTCKLMGNNTNLNWWVYRISEPSAVEPTEVQATYGRANLPSTPMQDVFLGLFGGVEVCLEMFGDVWNLGISVSV